MPALAERDGQDIVTSDGTTLLGADDKAGVAVIMSAAARLVRDDRPRAKARIAFTVDEEVGKGTDHFDLAAFGADFAYTLDGSGLGEIEIESFSAYQLRLTVEGVGVHPGTAKGRLVNAIKLVADVVAALPREGLSPETTEEREGFVHPMRIVGTTTRTTLTLLARDHDDAKLEEHVELVRRLASEIVGREPRASFTLEVTEQYRNMRKALDLHPEIVDVAEEAIRRAGVEPVHTIIRGGTDGSRLTEKGLPTPNLFTGGQNYHSVREWASVQDMAAAAATVCGARTPVGRARSASPFELGRSSGSVGVGRMNLAAEPLVAEAAHLADDREERRALLGQLVLDARRRLRVAAPHDDLLGLQPAQTLGERPRADPRAGVLELGKAPRALREVVHDQDRPLRADDLARGGDGALPRLVDREHRARRIGGRGHVLSVRLGEADAEYGCP